jgi:hypothetical protein
MHQSDFFKNEQLLISHIYEQLCIKWRTMLLAIPEKSPTSIELDEIQFAIILVSQSLPDECEPLITSQSMQCRELCYGRWYGDINAYSWELLMPQLPDLQKRSFVKLPQMLTHPDSGMRTWFLKIAWLLRAKLNAEVIIPKLLANVANTLTSVEQSYGIAYAIFDHSRQDFSEFALGLNPDPKFQEQYTERLASFSKIGHEAICGSYWKMEAEANKRIIENMIAVRGFVRGAH